MKELKKVTSMLGTVLTKEEIEEFMAEADVVSNLVTVEILSFFTFLLHKVLRTPIIIGWKWEAWLWWVCQDASSILTFFWLMLLYICFWNICFVQLKNRSIKKSLILSLYFITSVPKDYSKITNLNKQIDAGTLDKVVLASIII